MFKTWKINIKIICIILFLIPNFFITAFSNETGIIIVKVNNLKNNNGSLKFSLFNSKKGFPSNLERAIQKKSLIIDHNQLVVTFENVLYGEYALSVFHDENNNSKLDSNFIGIPKEGIGTSNNVKSKFGPPSYEDSKFSVNSSTTEININIVYL